MAERPAPRRRRVQAAPPDGLDAQLAWLGNQQKPLKNGQTRAEREAQRLVSKFSPAGSDADIEDLSLTASHRAVDRVRRKLEREGALPVVGTGLPGYFRQTLRNEVDRALGRLARRNAAQLAPGESDIVILDLQQRLPVPYGDVTEVVISVRAWAHRYHQRHVDAAEKELGRGSFATEVSGERHEIMLSTSSDPTDLRLHAQVEGPAMHLRVENCGIVGLHASVSLLGWRESAELRVLTRPVVLFDSRRGIGRAQVHQAGALPGRAQPVTPRKVAQRQIATCRTAERSSAKAARVIRRILAEGEHGSSNDRPLGLAGAPPVANDVWGKAAKQRSSTELTELICRLAEWATPGLHPPHRPGHPGGHPLRAEIAVAVSSLPKPSPPIAANTVHQRQRRMRQRVEDLIAQAARQAHDVIPEV